ncbi:hypothetical protein BD560DRAFT_79086 [Blakeslea trispora]|nr:hypothetical protein BD560DRAFT_79086 [Blakeslea trispora]
MSAETNQKTITILTPDRPYACTHCHQTFSRTHNLKSHLATHSAIRPFQCGTCLHYFRRQHDLKRHQKLHTGERPYVCGNCRRSFARLDALNRHLRVEGGTACHSNRRSSSNHKSAKKMEHKIYLANCNKKGNKPAQTVPSPSSQPLTSSPLSISSSSSFDHVSLPPLRANTLACPPSSPLYPPLEDVLSTKPYRSWTCPDGIPSPPSPILKRILPPLLSSSDLYAYQQQINSLEQENANLRKEIKQLSVSKARLHELEVENNLLRSLLADQRIQAVESTSTITDHSLFNKPKSS